MFLIAKKNWNLIEEFAEEETEKTEKQYWINLIFFNLKVQGWHKNYDENGMSTARHFDFYSMRLNSIFTSLILFIISIIVILLTVNKHNR